TYTWSVNNQRAFDQENREGNYRKYAPHVIVYIDKYQLNDSTIPVLSDLHQLYSWYSTHISELTGSENKMVKALADSLTSGLSSPEDKTSALYYWVQENIKYIAFEYGL